MFAGCLKVDDIVEGKIKRKNEERVVGFKKNRTLNERKD